MEKRITAMKENPVSALRQIHRAVFSRIREYTALLSEKTNPIEDRSMKWFFRISEFMLFMTVMVILLGVYMLATNSGKYVWILQCFAIALNGCTARFNFKDMLKLKKKARMEKVLGVVDVRVDEYETMTLKLAVTYPDLPPPDRAEYEKARNEAIHDEQVMSMLAAAASGKFTFTPPPPPPPLPPMLPPTP